MKYLKTFERLRDEYPGMFPEPEIPESVPGFEMGTIDPEDDEVYLDDEGKPLFSEKSEKELYEDFKKITKERNFEETSDEIKINIKRLYQDFCISIYNCDKHFRKFVDNELIGRYISKGFKRYNFETPEITYIPMEGIIEKVLYHLESFDCEGSINLKLKDIKFSDDTTCESIIIIDKLKSSASKYGI